MNVHITKQHTTHLDVIFFINCFLVCSCFYIKHGLSETIYCIFKSSDYVVCVSLFTPVK